MQLIWNIEKNITSVENTTLIVCNAYKTKTHMNILDGVYRPIKTKDDNYNDIALQIVLNSIE